MTDTVRQLIIQGVTASGRRFRPSDWAERLSGVMSQFRPPGVRPSHLTYSPYTFPTIINGVKCVVVDERLRELEPLAWKFVVDFAKDNDLITNEACMLPEDEAKPASIDHGGPVPEARGTVVSNDATLAARQDAVPREDAAQSNQTAPASAQNVTAQSDPAAKPRDQESV